jgi:hypothetical protein
VTTFVAIEAEADASTLEQESIALLESAFAGWTPAAGGLDVWLIKAFSRIGASIFDQATLVSTGAFKKFGESVVNVPPIQAAPATAESKWTMVDNAGYTVPAGTQVAIEKDGQTSLGFISTEAVEIAPGATTGTISLAAVEPGEEGNGLSADPKLIDALAYVSKIELEGVTANGVDEEPEDAYLNRLVETLQLLSLSLIVGRDFEIDARAVAGIARAKCLEAYNASESKEEALCVSVYPVDDAGAKLSAGIKEALQERQEAKVPSGVLVFVADPTYTKIKVKTKIVVETGFDSATAIAAVKARLEEYLAPANWGIPSQGDASTSGGWINQTKVYRFELVSEVDRVGGVDRVATLELVKEGGSLGTADITLEGVVPLTEAGSITVEV